eukprot:6194655-Pleurochrysis_carterae.AAC.2
MPACIIVVTRALGPGAAAPRAASDARSCHSGADSSLPATRRCVAAAATPTVRPAATVGRA